jgi:hypothetical protein
MTFSFDSDLFNLALIGKADVCLCWHVLTSLRFKGVSESWTISWRHPMKDV